MDILLHVNELVIYRYSSISFNSALVNVISKVVFSYCFSYATKVDAQNTEKNDEKYNRKAEPKGKGNTSNKSHYLKYANLLISLHYLNHQLL